MRKDGLNLSKYMAESDTMMLEWIDAAPGEFSVMMMSSDPEYQYIYLHQLELLVKKGYLERVGKKRGWYRRRQLECEPMDFLSATEEPVKLRLPLRLSKYVQIHPGNIIIVAGAPNSGKTALMLNIIRENMDQWNTNYFTSEMDAGELRLRLKKFPDMTLDMWKFKAYRRGADFADVIEPGPGNLNIIDFLEVHDEFYIVAKRLKEIHDRLQGAIAIVGLQKNPGVDTGLGGWRSMEVTRLAIALEYGRCKITKAKNWADPTKNPNGWQIGFKLVDGCRIIPDNIGWQKTAEKEMVSAEKDDDILF